MLAKACQKGVDWVRFIPLALFALRQMPHVDTGMSPFDLVYGFRVRGPLDLLYMGWVDDVCRPMNVTQWVISLQDRLQQLQDLSMARSKVEKDKQREKSNRNRSDRTLKTGDQVLMKVPGRSGALQSSWEGPYRVSEVLSRVNYSVVGEGTGSGGRVVHINNLKQLRPRESKVFRVIVAEESAEEREVCEKKSMLGEEKCAGFKEEELAGVLEEFQELFSERPGLCTCGSAQ